MDPGELWKILSRSVRRVSQNTLGNPAFRGRCRHSIWQVVKLYLLGAWLDLGSRQLYQRIQKVPGFRRQYGLPNRLISLSQYKKRLHSPLFWRALQKLLEYSASRALELVSPQESEVILMDLTSIPSNPKKDPYARWGFDSKGPFYGYKLGLIATRGGVILGMTLMTANHVEFRVQKRLQRQARGALDLAGRLPRVRYVLADSGFDGEQTYRASRMLLGAAALIPARRKADPTKKSAQRSLRRSLRRTPHRSAARVLWNSPERRAIYPLRGEIERLNGQLKNDRFRIHSIPRRGKGVRRLRRLMLAKLLIYNFTVNVNARLGRPLRAVAWSAA